MLPKLLNNIIKHYCWCIQTYKWTWRWLSTFWRRDN